MNKFDEHWQQGATEARKAPPQEAPSAPHGFATRVVARWKAERKAAPSWLQLWDVLSRRALIYLAAALLVCAAMNWPTDSQSGISRPPIEEAVSDLFMSL